MVGVAEAVVALVAVAEVELEEWVEVDGALAVADRRSQEADMVVVVAHGRLRSPGRQWGAGVDHDARAPAGQASRLADLASPPRADDLVSRPPRLTGRSA